MIRKKILSIIIIVLLLLVMPSCANTKDKLLYNKYDIDLSEYINVLNYKNIPVGTISYNVSQYEVDKQVLLYRSEHAERVVVLRGATYNDALNLDIYGYIDGKLSNYCSDLNCDIVLGAESITADFDEKLIGVKAGETVEFDVTFPSNYINNMDLSGVECKFKVVVNKVYEQNLPAYDTEFVKKYYNYDSIETFEAAIKLDLLSMYQDCNTKYVIDQCWNYVIDNTVVKSYPNDYYNENYDAIVGMYVSDAATSGKTLLDYVKNDLQFASLESFYDWCGQKAKELLKEDMIVYYIARCENITITEEEYDGNIAMYASVYGYSDVKSFETDYDKLEIQELMLFDKVLSSLTDWTVRKQ